MADAGKERIMPPQPDEPPGANGQPKNEDLFRIYIVFVAIAVLLTVSLPLLA
jgi:hypothetical protein